MLAIILSVMFLRESLHCKHAIIHSIYLREMLAILLSVLFLRKSLHGKHVIIHKDNKVTFFSIKRMGSLKNPIMMQL